MRSSTRTKKADASPRVSLRFGQNESGPQPLVIPAAAKASIADSAQCRLSSEKASGTSRESPSALTAIAANSARVRSLSGQKALGAQPLTMPSAASRLIAFWNLLFPSSLKKSFVVAGRPITRWKKAAASPLVMVRSGQARRYPHPNRSPRACNSVRAGLKRLELSSCERVHATDAAMRRDRHLIDDQSRGDWASASRHRSRRCATCGGS